MGTRFSKIQSHIPKKHTKLVHGYLRKSCDGLNIPNVIACIILASYSVYDYFNECGAAIQVKDFIASGKRNRIQSSDKAYPMQYNTAYGNQFINVKKDNEYWINEYRWICSVSGEATIGIDSSNHKWTHINFTEQKKFQEYKISGVNPYYAFVINNKKNEILTQKFDGINYYQSRNFMIKKMQQQSLPLDFVGPEPDPVVHYWTFEEDDEAEEDDGIWYYISLLIHRADDILKGSMQIVNEFGDKIIIGDVKFCFGDVNLCYQLAVSVINGDRFKSPSIVRLHDFIVIE